ncbi:MAG: hypothetical protein WCF04_09720 [Candidatus Nanopelagicales bacterium]
MSGLHPTHRDPVYLDRVFAWFAWRLVVYGGVGAAAGFLWAWVSTAWS